MNLAEYKLLNRLAEEMLSPEGVALLERRIREQHEGAGATTEGGAQAASAAGRQEGGRD